MLSKEGKCRAFGEGGDGFVPGEGVGAVLLKPLSLAEKDGDHIYAIIRGTAVNHGGRTNGYTVPNPAAQAEVISEALRRSGVDAGTLSYVEAHGTGTALGDPIEVAGLARAFANSSSGDASGQTCALGSVKTNIGHLEAAAGIAGLTKVLLQMVHGQLVPSLNADQLNANISFAGTSFRLQRTLDQWPRFETDGKPGPRRAGISSFGAGGANAHIVVEEYIPPKIAGQTASASMLILLSAKNPERLRKVALNLCEFLRSRGGETETLHSIAYTLQVGREAMEERVAFVTADRVDLLSKLDLVALGQFEGFAAGRVRREKVQLGAEAVDVEPDATVAEALEGRQLERLGELWATGAMVDWRLLWSSSVPIGRVSLPGYPFAAERYWAPDIPGIANDAQEVASDLSHAALATLPTSSPRLHPLLHRDESTLNAHLFASELIDKEVTLRDHRVSGRLVLPGAATLEMALAGAERVFGTTDVRLRQVVWMRSLVPGTESLEIKLHLHPENDDRLFFELRDRKGIIHVQGKAEIDSGFHQESMDIGAIRARCSQEITPEKLYTGFAERGLEYGPGFRVIQEIRYADNEVISLLETPAAWEGEKFRLHPALVDGALQSLALIGAGVNGIELPFTVDEVAYGNTLPARCYAFCQIETKHVGGRRYRVFLMDENGLVLARLTSLSLRGPEQKRMELFYCRPGWEKKSAQTKLTGDEPVLLLDERMDLAECLERRGVSTVRVVQGAAYERIGDVVSIRRNNNEDYVRLVHDVPFGAVIHRWSEAGCGLEDALDRGLFSVHRLAQALAGRRKATKYLYVYPLGEAAYEAISGYAKSLNQELVNVRLKMVGVDSELEDLLAEINEPNSDVRYYQGQREVRKLER
jgi:acyl transferase domain-containing protein